MFETWSMGQDDTANLTIVPESQLLLDSNESDITTADESEDTSTTRGCDSEATGNPESLPKTKKSKNGKSKSPSSTTLNPVSTDDEAEDNSRDFESNVTPTPREENLPTKKKRQSNRKTVTTTTPLIVSS